MRNRIASTVATIVISGGAITAVSPGSPAAAASCGDWSPANGSISSGFVPIAGPQRFSVASVDYIIRVTFSFSQSNINELHCYRSSAMDVDSITFGAPLKGRGTRSWSSNMPAAFLDTEAYDDAKKGRVLTVATTAAQELKANTEYFTEIRLSGIDLHGVNYAETYLNFQRGHWASNVDERALCTLHGGSDPAWCVNASGDATYIAKRYGIIPRPIYHGAFASSDIVDWGTRRRTSIAFPNSLAPGTRLYSPNGLNQLVMQSDGNLVEYIPGGQVVWSSNTGQPGSVLQAQSDGNFVVIAPGNRPMWSPSRWAKDAIIRLQDDRNLVVYAPGNIGVWSNGVAGR